MSDPTNVRPIIFSTPMVRALLEGRKTQTRRMPTPTWRKVQPGDLLWVRESFFLPDARLEEKRFVGGCYKADVTSPASLKYTGWRPSIHMPRWASRITLAVTEVRTMPLLDISEDDAKAEGFEAGQLDDGFGPQEIGDGFTIQSSGTWASAGGMFQMAWEKLHPEWDGFSSPEVIALNFTVEVRNVDQTLT